MINAGQVPAQQIVNVINKNKLNFWYFFTNFQLLRNSRSGQNAKQKRESSSLRQERWRNATIELDKVH